VIGIFASVDYGVSFMGLTALLMMLNSWRTAGGRQHRQLFQRVCNRLPDALK
jgi:hypothetical protein